MQLVIVFTSICSIRKILEIIDDLLIFREKIEENEDVCCMQMRLWEEEKSDVQCWVSSTKTVWQRIWYLICVNDMYAKREFGH
jgi:hypothetical protein